jgi:hypothetical protein
MDHSGKGGKVRTSDRLWQRLCAMGLADLCGVGLRPLRRSRASRTEGAWSWTAINADGIPLPLGSQVPMAELLAAKRLMAIMDWPGDVTVDVERGHDPPDMRAGQWTRTGVEQVLLEDSS